MSLVGNGLLSHSWGGGGRVPRGGVLAGLAGDRRAEPRRELRTMPRAA